MKNYKLIPKIALLALIVLGIIFAVMFYFGGNLEGITHKVAGDELAIPRFTDLFLIWVYILTGIAVIITLVAVTVAFANIWRYNRRKAITILCVILGFVALVFVCWMLGSSKEINITGYEGHDNVGFWAKASDMVIYLCYTLLGATLLTMLGGYIYTKRLK